MGVRRAFSIAAIIGVVAATVIGLGIARRTHVRTSGDNVRVETPFGSVESSKNAEDAAKNLGVEIYPGARSVGSEAASVVVGSMKTVSASFESSDPADKVFEFYREKFPRANVTESSGGQHTIISTGKNALITINIQNRDGTTHIQITNVANKSASHDEPTN